MEWNKRIKHGGYIAAQRYVRRVFYGYFTERLPVLD